MEVVIVVNITTTRKDIDAMLADEAAKYGYTLDELRDMATSGVLEEPELRDLWIIWGDSPLSYSRQP